MPFLLAADFVAFSPPPPVDDKVDSDRFFGAGGIGGGTGLFAAADPELEGCECDESESTEVFR
jgi:hypothetical protein